MEGRMGRLGKDSCISGATFRRLGARPHTGDGAEAATPRWRAGGRRGPHAGAGNADNKGEPFRPLRLEASPLLMRHRNSKRMLDKVLEAE